MDAEQRLAYWIEVESVSWKLISWYLTDGHAQTGWDMFVAMMRVSDMHYVAQRVVRWLLSEQGGGGQVNDG